MVNDFDAVILADGTFPSAEIPREVLNSASFLCCCDNAGRRLIESGGRIPDAIVGDGDSLPESFKERYKDIYHQVTEQDYNDLTKATRFCIEFLKNKASLAPHPTNLSPLVSKNSHLRIAYLAATGKREDHTIGNISLLSFYQREFGIEPVMITDYGIFTAHCGNSTIETFPRQQVSIFNVNCQNITSEGMKWDAYTYKELWQGTLNEALGDSVTFHADGAYIVYRTHKPKS